MRIPADNAKLLRYLSVMATQHPGTFIGDLFSEAATALQELEAELERKHQNPTDYRYWEGRWRDTQAECDTAIRERDMARKALERIANPGTVGGMHPDDRDKRLQTIARNALDRSRSLVSEGE